MLYVKERLGIYKFINFLTLFQSYYFDRDDIALPGLKKYFEDSSKEETEHAKKFMEYMNKRGGRIHLTDILAPDKQEWGTAQDAMIAALELEKNVNEVINLFY